MPRKLTLKQRRFAEFFDGNRIETARRAGYAGSNHTLSVLADRNLKIPEIVAIIKARDEKLQKELEERLLEKAEKEGIKREYRIATRKERQDFWTRVMEGREKETIVTANGETIEKAPKMSDRLKAAELLGKSQADFLERRREEGSLTVKIVKYSDDKESECLARR